MEVSASSVMRVNIPEYQKSQMVRLVDVFVIAPVLIYAGSRKSSLSPALKYTLIGIGIATAVYNGNNYMKNEEKNAASIQRNT
jgi:hypothetical protein